jgi:Tfp pilus assembly protein PilO
MKISSSNRVIIAMFVVAAPAVVFWMLLLSPKKEEVSKLGKQIVQQEESLALHQGEVEQGLAAQKAFPAAYQQLVVLGKAAPSDDDTASLLVQLTHIAERSKLRFETFQLSSGGEESESPEPTAAPEAGQGEAYPPATEVAASTMPLGAAIGPAGLAVMPYTLTFKGSFFHVADFIHGLDSLVRTTNEEVEVTGRLITIDGFNLKEDGGKGFPALEADFTVTTFLVPPEQGITGGASPTSPEAEASTQVSTTTGGTP